MQQSEADDTGKPPRFRERHRQARHREFLDAARRIVAADGPDALTMQRVTDDLGTSVGGIYIYFPTKDSLLVELQREALNSLHASYLLGQARLDDHLRDHSVDPAPASLARLLATARFWTDAHEHLAGDLDLSRRVFAPHGETDEAGTVLPAVLRFLEDIAKRLDEAVSAGALEAADNLERSAVLVAAVNGVLLASTVRGWDESLFDGGVLATRLSVDLFVGWGAERSALDEAAKTLEGYGAIGHLAPPPA